MPAEVPVLTTWVALTAAPLLAITCTSFTKISIVLSALRAGLSEWLIPWSAVFALSVALTAVVMGPIALECFAALERMGGVVGLSQGPGTAVVPVLAPLQGFLQAHADAGELEFFAGLQGGAADHPLALVPAFLITELGEALQIALIVLVPFVLVDLIVGQVLVLMGLTNTQSQPLVSLPFKISLFLAIGGWDLLVRQILEGYA